MTTRPRTLTTKLLMRWAVGEGVGGVEDGGADGRRRGVEDGGA